MHLLNKTIKLKRFFVIVLFNQASQLRTNSYLQWQPTPAKPGPIVCRPVGLPITAGCDTAWIRTRVPVVTPKALFNVHALQ